MGYDVDSEGWAWDCYRGGHCIQGKCFCYFGLQLDCMVKNIEVAAALSLVRIGAYSKGFDDATQMREFCEPGGGADYFPMADSRPTADRLGW